ncbi:SRPBCC family protein [Robertkochia flava]|uniref:SRPBCC family protein n=1 Tax=Robertkochia flava TaxID=3447986 RepID=UPI001CCE5227|nr:SRPBCC domain-containing protein [Robertkochia marina]
MKTTDAPVIVSQSFSLPGERIWEAITQHREMVQWYFQDIPDFRPEVGFTTSFTVENEGRSFTHTWEVVEATPNKCIAYQWYYKEYPGCSVLRMELLDKEQTTELQVSHLVTADFPSGIPEFQREQCELGWKYFIQDALKQYLLGKTGE